MIGRSRSRADLLLHDRFGIAFLDRLRDDLAAVRETRLGDRCALISRQLVAARPVARLDLGKLRLFDRAALKDLKSLFAGSDLHDVLRLCIKRELARAVTARMELAAAGKARGVGDGAGDLLEPAALIAQFGNSAE